MHRGAAAWREPQRFWPERWLDAGGSDDSTAERRTDGSAGRPGMRMHSALADMGTNGAGFEIVMLGTPATRCEPSPTADFMLRGVPDALTAVLLSQGLSCLLERAGATASGPVRTRPICCSSPSLIQS